MCTIDTMRYGRYVWSSPCCCCGLSRAVCFPQCLPSEFKLRARSALVASRVHACCVLSTVSVLLCHCVCECHVLCSPLSAADTDSTRQARRRSAEADASTAACSDHRTLTARPIGPQPNCDEATREKRSQATTEWRPAPSALESTLTARCMALSEQTPLAPTRHNSAQDGAPSPAWN